MNILLILPDGNIHKLQLGAFKRSMREAPLTLSVLAALVPEELNADITIIDESIDTVPLDFEADIVGISIITGTANRAYEIADHFRSKGSTVVLGGIHATVRPEEASIHADAVLTGPAETTWPRLLRDFSKGQLKPFYKPQPVDTSLPLSLPLPRYDLMRKSRYMLSHTVMATRGCRHSCGFCSIPPQGYGYQIRPVPEVLRDIQSSKARMFAFNDVSLVDNREYAFELFTAIKPLKKRWGGLATTQILKDPELVKLMSESGCRYLLIGFESFGSDSLSEIKKGFNRKNDYKQLTGLLHQHNIAVQGCFIFGFDSDNTTVFDETVNLVNEVDIDIPRYAVLTPYPGTGLFRQLENEKRIRTYNWKYYDTMHLVFEPKQMSPEELYTGFKKAWKDTYRIPDIIKRTAGFRFSNIVNFFGNMNYRKFSRRLYRDSFYSLPEPIPSKQDFVSAKEDVLCRM